MRTPRNRMFVSTSGWTILAPLVLVGLIALGLGACSSSSDDPTEPEDPGPIFAPTPGTVTDLPDGADYDDYTVQTAGDSIDVSPDGTFTVVASRNRPQLFVLNDAADRPVHLSVFGGEDDASIMFSAEETAHALVFLHPLMMTETTSNWRRARTITSTRPAFDSLVLALQASVMAGRVPGDEDPEVSNALSQLYSEMSSYLWDNFRYWKEGGKASLVGPNGGLEVIDVEVAPDSSQVSLRVVNERRRWVSIYARPHDEAGYRPAQRLEMLPSPRVSFFSYVLDGMDDREATTAIHTINTEDCDRLRVDCYGLGLGNVEEDDWNYAMDAILCPFIFDYGLPFTEALRGQSGLTTVGDPVDDPLMTLLAAVRDRGGATFRNDLQTALRMQDAEQMLTLLMDALFETILADPALFGSSMIEQLREVEGDEAADVVSQTLVEKLAGGLSLVAEGVDGSEGLRTLGSTLALPSTMHFRVDLGDMTEYPHLLRGRIRDAVTEFTISQTMITVFDLEGNPLGNTQGSNVGYFEIDVPPGEMIVRYSRRGYRGFDHLIKIYHDDPVDYWLDYVDMVPASEGIAGLEGIVTNAVTGLQVSGVTVQLLPGYNRLADDIIATAVTSVRGDSLGYYAMHDLVPGSYTVRTAAPGFNPAYMNVTLRPGHFESIFQLLMAPEGTTTLRVVLAWGANPSDLDSHMLVPEGAGPEFDVRWNHRGSYISWPYADLDVDDTTGYGPETITIAQAQPGTYQYAVYHWAGTGGIPTSQARVMVYGSTGLLREWRAPSAGTGRWWHVFDLDAQAERLYSINTVTEMPPPGIEASKASGAKIP